MSTLRKQPQRPAESGTVLVIVTFWMSLAILMATLVIDVGHWFEHKRHLQLQVDAAALAGGDVFGSCFNGGGGDTRILNEATKYAGSAGTYNGVSYGTPLYNAQIGGTHKGPVSILYQSRSYANGLNPGDGTETQAPCETPSFMLDVKATESNLPWFLGAGKLVSAINAHARVQLQAVGDSEPSLPLAVPDVNPRKVAVTFVDESSGTELTGCSGSNLLTGTTCTFTLTKGSPSGGLNNWSGTAGVAIPASAVNVGMRVGMGGGIGSCANTVGGANFACYDNITTTQGLYKIRTYVPGGAVGTGGPAVDGVWPTTSPTTCSGNQYYSNRQATSGSCPAGVQARVNFGTGSVIPSTSTYTLAASVANFDGTKKSTSATMTPVAGSYDATTNTWLWQAANGSVSLTTGVGVQAITLNWTVKSGTSPICPGTKNCSGSVSPNPIHRFYSAPVDATGPVQTLSVTESGLDVASLKAGTGIHTLSIAVGISGNYAIHTPCTPPPSGGSYNCPTDRATLIRFASASGSRTYAVDCGTIPGHTGGDLYQQILYGCANRFSINQPDICPDTITTPPPDPTDCVPIGNVGSGVKTGQVRQALNDKYVNNPPFNGTCAANNYPTVVPGDPRVLILMVTDFAAFEGSGGSSTVPVITYGAFYLTGWDGAPGGCDNEPFANTGVGGSSAQGDIWGHFIAYVDPNGRSHGGFCDPSGLLPCTPVLTQ